MGDMIAWLQSFIEQPAIYLSLVFVYAILVAIILPIPIEFALIWPFVDHDLVLFVAVTIVMAAGKATGALAILKLGIKVEKTVHYWEKKIKWFERVVHYFTLFVKKTGIVGLYLILSVPLMTDTVPIYIYSIFHEDGKALRPLAFGLSNFLAAINRAVIIALFIALLGIKLV